MSRHQTAAIVLAAASATAICAAQTPGGAGALAINGAAAAGGTARLDAARRVLITTTGAEAGKTVTLKGTDRTGVPIVEALALPNAGTVQSLQDFATVTSATISAAAAAPLSVGTSAVASTRWIRLDVNRHDFAVTLALDCGGVAATVNVEGTVDPVDKAAVDSGPNGNGDSSAAGLATSTFTPPYAFALQTGLNSDQLVQLATPVGAVRLTVTAGAASAGVRATVVQQGV